MNSLFEQATAFAAADEQTPDSEAVFRNDDIIHRVTRTQLLDDGALVDLTVLAPDVCAQHIPRIPLACTARVWGIIERALANPRWCNDINGVTHDLLWMARGAIEGMRAMREFPTSGGFKVIIKGAGRQSIYHLKIVLSQGDHGEATLTIMVPDED